MPPVRRFFAALAMAVPGLAVAAAPIAMHRDPGCPCCAKWAAQVRAQFSRQVQIIDDARRAAFLTSHGVPADLASCHTAVVDGMVFEGHVPIADMKRALAQRPKGVTGLAVPGMPMGSAGMETSRGKGQAYDVIAFGPAGRSVFAHHRA